MNLLLFSDLHCDTAACDRLVELAADADLVLGAGDFGIMRRHVHVCIEVLSEIACPAVVVPGNAESAEELQEACRQWPSAVVLHGSGTKTVGIDCFGLGGGIPATPFGAWSYDFTEDQAQELAADCPQGGILVTHSPPFGAVDRDSQGRELGSRAIRELIERRQPRLTVCGHIHAGAGESAEIGDTLIVNAGPEGVIMSWPELTFVSS